MLRQGSAVGVPLMRLGRCRQTRRGGAPGQHLLVQPHLHMHMHPVLHCTCVALCNGVRGFCVRVRVQVVVLSPDATEPLAAVDRGRVYVIGGIVDRTHIKGLTLQYAVSSTVRHSFGAGQCVPVQHVGSDFCGRYGESQRSATGPPSCHLHSRSAGRSGAHPPSPAVVLSVALAGVPQRGGPAATHPGARGAAGAGQGHAQEVRVVQQHFFPSSSSTCNRASSVNGSRAQGAGVVEFAGVAGVGQAGSSRTGDGMESPR